MGYSFTDLAADVLGAAEQRGRRQDLHRRDMAGEIRRHVADEDRAGIKSRMGGEVGSVMTLLAQAGAPQSGGRSKRIRRPAAVVGLMAATVALMALTAAPIRAAEMRAAQVTYISPRGTASLNGTTTIRANADGPDITDVGPTYTYRISNRYTRFYWDTTTPFTTQGVFSLSRNIFFSRLSKKKSPICGFDWRWRRDSRGHRYRYITRIKNLPGYF